MDWNHFPFLDMQTLFAGMHETAAPSKLTYFLKNAGATPHPTDEQFFIASAARIVAVGGIPIQLFNQTGKTVDNVFQSMRANMGVMGSMSYLQLPGGSPKTAYEKIVLEHGHQSCLHTAHLSVLISGISCATANEFNSQRDEVHAARITETRTNIQSAPPIALPSPSLYEAYKELRELALKKIASNPLPGDKRNAHEALNGLFPAHKATAMVLTASLKNFVKLLRHVEDNGKELQMRLALCQIGLCLSAVLPEIFNSQNFEDILLTTKE
jgi:hypothetical protein